MKFDLGPSPHLRSARPAAKAMSGEDDLQSIENALERLESGDYGYCECCSAPIALSRLCINPAVSLCRDCEES